MILCNNANEVTVVLPQMRACDDGHVVRFKRYGNAKAHVVVPVQDLTGRRSTIYYDRGAFIDAVAGETLVMHSPGDAMELVWVMNLTHTVNGTRYEGMWVQYKFPRDW